MAQENEKPFKEQFRELRVKIGTQTDVSLILGVHLQTVSNIERGVDGYSLPDWKKRKYMEVLENEVLRLADEELERKRRLQGIK